MRQSIVSNNEPTLATILSLLKILEPINLEQIKIKGFVLFCFLDFCIFHFIMEIYFSYESSAFQFLTCLTIQEISTFEVTILSRSNFFYPLRFELLDRGRYG